MKDKFLNKIKEIRNSLLVSYFIFLVIKLFDFRLFKLDYLIISLVFLLTIIIVSVPFFKKIVRDRLIRSSQGEINLKLSTASFFEDLVNHKQAKEIVFALLILGLFTSIFVLKSSQDLLVIFLSLFWFFASKILKIDPFLTIKFGIFLIILSPIVLSLKGIIVAQQFSVWAYVFLLLGFTQLFLKFLKNNDKSI